MKRIIAATAEALIIGVQAIEASGPNDPLAGAWRHDSNNLVGEYHIEHVADDGSVEGSICTVKDGDNLWGSVSSPSRLAL